MLPYYPARGGHPSMLLTPKESSGLVGRDQPRNMLRAIPVPREDAEDDAIRDPGRAGGLHECGDKLVVVRNSCAAPHLQPPCVGVIHQKKKRALVFSQVTDADVLRVAPVLCKSDGTVVQDLQEAGRAATVLHIGLTIGARSRQIGGVAVPIKAIASADSSRANPPAAARRAWASREPRRACSARTAAENITSSGCKAISASGGRAQGIAKSLLFLLRQSIFLAAASVLLGRIVGRIDVID
jgi:hypothetical protein